MLLFLTHLLEAERLPWRQKNSVKIILGLTLMKNILKSIENSLQNKNWYSALILSLILPDICGKLENTSKSSSERYPEWFDKYLGKKYNGFLSGNNCYALRCSFLHEGSGNIEKQRAKENLDHFVFVSN